MEFISDLEIVDIATCVEPISHTDLLMQTIIYHVKHDLLLCKVVLMEGGSKSPTACCMW